MPGFVLFVDLVADQDGHAQAGLLPDGVLHGGEADLCPVGKRHGDHGLVFADRFDEQAQWERVEMPTAHLMVAMIIASRQR